MKLSSNGKMYGLLAVLLALTACQSISNGGSRQDPDSGSNGPQQVVLSYAFMDDGPTYELYQSMFREYEKENPHVQISSQLIPDNYSSAILTRIAGGNAPDIFWINNESIISFAARDALLDLSGYDGDLFESSDFLPNMLDAYSYDGSIYGLPADSAPNVLFYNRELFDEAGVDYPTPGMSWDELRALAEQMTISDNGRISTYGYAMDINWFYWQPFLWQAEGNILNEDASASIINSAENKEAFEFLRGMMDDHIAPSPSDLSSTAGYQLFANGNAAMYFGGAWVASTVFREVDFQWDITRQPHHREEANVMGLGGFAISKPTKHPEEAVKFLAWFAGEQGQRQKFESGFAGMPTVHSLIDTELATKGFEHPDDPTIALEEIAEAVKVSRTAPHSPHWAEISAEIGTELQLYWIGDQDIDTTLERLDKKINDILK